MFAELVLWVWPVMGFVLASALGRVKGIIWAMLLGFFFLPSALAIDLPGLPPYNKFTAIAVAMLAGFMVAPSPQDRAFAPPVRPFSDPIVMGLLAVLFVSPILTWLGNTQPLFFGPKYLPGLTFSDALSMWAGSFSFLVPFLVGYALLGDPRNFREMIRALIMIGGVYMLLALWEIRMSPQLHTQLYGYFPHQFAQHFRAGGYRPVVFLDHGLTLGFMFLSMLILVGAQIRAGEGTRGIMTFVFAAFLATLILSKTLGALMLALIFLPLLLAPPRTQVVAASVAAVAALLYPILRQLGLVPLQTIAGFAASVDPGRAGSFMFRVQNEDLFLDRVAGSPIWGWGGWGRGRVFNEFGIDVSTADGGWIVWLATLGWVGFLTYMGLLGLPIIALLLRRSRRGIDPIAAGIALVSAANLLYLIPNTTYTPIGLALAGAMLAYSRLEETAPDAAGAAVAGSPRRLGYTRFPKTVAEGGGASAAAVTPRAKTGAGGRAAPPSRRAAVPRRRRPLRREE